MKLIVKVCAIFIFVQGISKSQSLDLNAIKLAQKFSKSQSPINSVAKREKNQDYFIADRILDSDLYIVGPGDLLHINIIASSETFDHSIAISPSGKLLIPSVGIVNCEQLTLSQLIEEITKQIKSWNASVKVNVELKQIREFRVLVIGQFSNAGYFIVTPMTRFSDLFNQIISDYNQRYKDSMREEQNKDFYETSGMRSRIAVDDFYDRKLGLDKEPYHDIDHLSKRNIELIRNNDTIIIDIEKFKVTGDYNYNPYIHQDDIIRIPYKSQFFTIQGGVQKPGRYEYNSSDNIADALAIAGGNRPNAKLDSIRVTRSNKINNSESFFLTYERSKNTKMLSEDHIMIPFFYKKEPHHIVEIIGEISHPGSYPIEFGETSINEIIVAAGGFLPTADTSRIFINNSEIANIPDRELERILLKAEPYRSIEEQAYVKARLRTEKGALETSLSKIKHKDHLVSNKDIIYIPRHFPYVEVIGAVLSPGRYPFKDEKKSNSYITDAGGVAKNASKKRFLIKGSTGQRLKLNRKNKLEPGDIIFIPDKVDYNEWIAAKELVGALYQSGLLIYYIQTIIRNLNN